MRSVAPQRLQVVRARMLGRSARFLLLVRRATGSATAKHQHEHKMGTTLAYIAEVVLHITHRYVPREAAE